MSCADDNIAGSSSKADAGDGDEDEELTVDERVANDGGVDEKVVGDDPAEGSSVLPDSIATRRLMAARSAAKWSLAAELFCDVEPLAGSPGTLYKALRFPGVNSPELDAKEG